MDLNRIKKIHIIGIEGAGTSALARMLNGLGKQVTGSDEGDHFYADMLSSAGIITFSSFSKENISSDTDLVIYSTAHKPELNEEVRYAQERFKTITYGESLAELFNQKYGIAVCGSHGKTTTSAWLSYVLDKSGLSPSAIIGSKVMQFDGNSLIGNSNYLVVEADEYQNKLQHLQPKMVLLNNIDYDHPDYYPTVDSYQQVFVDFISRIPAKGFLVTNFDDPIIRRIANVNCKGKVISYAIDESADYVAYNIKQNDGKQYFSVKLGVDLDDEDVDVAENDLGDFSIGLSGRHNISNALAVIATCVELGIDLMKIRLHLADFVGTARRAQVAGTWRGATIIDDYAHHPTEIKTTLAGIKEKYPQSKIRVIFHPHTFTRTKALLDDFAASFSSADEVVVLDIYGSAREQQGGVHSKDLVDKIVAIDSEKKVLYIPTQTEVEEYLLDTITRGEIIVLMGAGDVFRIGQRLLADH